MPRQAFIGLATDAAETGSSGLDLHQDLHQSTPPRHAMVATVPPVPPQLHVYITLIFIELRIQLPVVRSAEHR